MKKFLIRRILISMILLVFVSMIIYGIMRCMPASFVETKAMQLAEKPGAKSYEEWLEQLNASYGLDTGIIQGYFTWASKAVRGQFGDSWNFSQPVLQKFSSVIWYYHSDSGRCGGCEEAVFHDRLFDYGVCAHRNFPSQLFLCDDPEMDICREAELAGSLWDRRPYASAAEPGWAGA